MTTMRDRFCIMFQGNCTSDEKLCDVQCNIMRYIISTKIIVCVCVWYPWIMIITVCYYYRTRYNIQLHYTHIHTYIRRGKSERVSQQNWTEHPQSIHPSPIANRKKNRTHPKENIHRFVVLPKQTKQNETNEL